MKICDKKDKHCFYVHTFSINESIYKYECNFGGACIHDTAKQLNMKQCRSKLHCKYELVLSIYNKVCQLKADCYYKNFNPETDTPDHKYLQHIPTCKCSEDKYNESHHAPDSTSEATKQIEQSISEKDMIYRR